MRKGDRLEKNFTEKLHKKNYPVLISSKLLRSLNAGQIDAARILKNHHEWQIILYELKSSMEPSAVQRHRLRLTQDYLSKVLEMSVKLEVKFCQKDEA